MSKSHARHRNTFEGGIDMDTTPELMAPGDYIDAENVMSGYGQVEGGLSVQKIGRAHV